MSHFSVSIDGKEVEAGEGETILHVALRTGIHIPTLCHDERMTPVGACRICVVEVEGFKTLVGACHTPVEKEMVIRTHTPKVLSVRKAVVELMLASHRGPCVSDLHAGDCRLHALADELEVGKPRFQVRRVPFFPVEEISPYVRRDLSKCILCRRCVGACSEIAGKRIYGVGYRGFRSKIVVNFDEPINEEVCRDCGVCIDFCPTGALSRPGGGEGNHVFP